MTAVAHTWAADKADKAAQVNHLGAQRLDRATITDPQRSFTPLPADGRNVQPRQPISGNFARVPLVQRCGASPETCPCHAQQEHDGRLAVQRQAAQSADMQGVPAVVSEAARTSGSALPGTLRTWLEDRFDASGVASTIAPAPTPVQGKLAVSQPSDASECEADMVATRVMSAKPPVPSKPENDSTRRTGIDLSRVRVHTDDVAARAARSVSASAYTVGHDIVFAPGAFAPHTQQGMALLVHELAHVVQQQRNPSLPNLVHRKACGHDGQITGCGRGGPTGKGSGLAQKERKSTKGRLWLEDKVTGAWTFDDIGDLVVQDMHKRFGGGKWFTRVEVPHGEVDGLKVNVGASLDAEIVEVKGRSMDGGGCNLADLEAKDYRAELDAIKGDFVAVSTSLAGGGGFRIGGGKNTPRTKAQAERLASAGATGMNPTRWMAWMFYNTLQNRLNKTFTTPFTALNVSVNADGDPTQTYLAAGPFSVDCRKGKKTSKGVAFLNYQVSGNGGASYGCDKQCPDEDEERKPAERRVQPEQQRSKTRLRDEGDEPEVREPGKEQRRDAPGQPQPSAPGVDAPPPERSVDPSYIPELLLAAAALAAAAKRASLSQAERVALEAAYKRIEVKLVEAGAEETAKRLAINGMKLGSKALTDAFEKDAANVLEKDLAKMSEKEVEKIAVREGEKLLEAEAKQALKQGGKALARRTAGRAVARAIPYLSILLVASDALAMADHVSKGGTIEIGLTGSEADLSGDTNVKTSPGAPKAGAGTDAKLTDTNVDIETTGVPSASGTAQIDAKKVTITGAARGDGTPVTVNFKTTLENSTITIKHAGVLRGGKVVLSGDVTVKDSQIEIDLPPGALAAPPSSGAPVVITGAKVRITSSGGAGGTGAGAGSGQQAAPTTATPSPTKKDESTQNALKNVSQATREKMQTVPGADELISALLVGGKGGVKADDTAVQAILKKLTDERVTRQEIDQLKTHVGGPASSVDEVLGNLDHNIKQLRAPAVTPGATGTAKSPATQPGTGAEQSAEQAKPEKPAEAAKPPDPNAPMFKRLKAGQAFVPFEKEPHAGEKLEGLRAYGKLDDGGVYTATVSIEVSPVWTGNQGQVKITSSSPLNTVKGAIPSHLVGKTWPMTITGKLKK